MVYLYAEDHWGDSFSLQGFPDDTDGYLLCDEEKKSAMPSGGNRPALPCIEYISA